MAGLSPSSAPDGAGACCSIEFSMAGCAGGLPPSSSVIAILKAPSTITTTLAPTRSERILEVRFEGSLALSPAALSGRPALSTGGAACAAWAARRAAAMELDVEAGPRGGLGWIPLIGIAEAAMRSDRGGHRPAR